MIQHESHVLRRYEDLSDYLLNDRAGFQNSSTLSKLRYPKLSLVKKRKIILPKREQSSFITVNYAWTDKFLIENLSNIII